MSKQININSADIIRELYDFYSSSSGKMYASVLSKLHRHIVPSEQFNNLLMSLELPLDSTKEDAKNKLEAMDDDEKLRWYCRVHEVAIKRSGKPVVPGEMYKKRVAYLNQLRSQLEAA